MSEAQGDALEFTGERFIPGTPGEIWYEHWHRYHFAAPLVAGLRVLDVACGEGYGSALLARSAAGVTGVDISPAAVARARSRYGGVPNVRYEIGDCAALPLPDASFDVVVSFETLEHVAAQDAFLDQAARVLRPDGLLVISCPNRVEYSERRGYANPFHLREPDRDELSAMLGARFGHQLWHGQRAGFFSVIWPEMPPRQASIFEVSEDEADRPSAGHGRPLYFLVVASRSASALSRVPPALSVLADRDERVYADYERAWREAQAGWARGDALEREVARWQAHHAEAVRQRDALLAPAGGGGTDGASGLAALQSELALRRREAERWAVEREAHQREIERRASLRWWLALPLRRLRNALSGRPPAA